MLFTDTENQHPTFREMWPFLPQRLEMSGVQQGQHHCLFSDFVHVLLKRWALSEGREAQCRSCTNFSLFWEGAVSRISTGAINCAAVPCWCKMRNKNPKLMNFCLSQMCPEALELRKTPLLLQRLPQSAGWALVAAKFHLCSHTQAKGRWNVLWLGE